MTIITLQQVKEEIPHNIYDYFKDNNLDGKDLNTITRTFLKDGKINYFFSLVEKLDLEQYLDEYKNALIENINARSEYNGTPLHYACYYGYYKIAQLLIDNEADVNAKDKDGKTPLHNASYYGNFKAVQFLIDNGADVNARNEYNETPLHYAFLFENLEIAELLIDKKADVNARDNNGETPLHDAFCYGNTKIAKLLLDNGARK